MLKHVIFLTLCILVYGIVFAYDNQTLATTNSTYTPPNVEIKSTNKEKVLEFSLFLNNKINKISVPLSKLLFDVTITKKFDEKGDSYRFNLDPKFTKLYEIIGNFDCKKNAVVIYPIFTQAAYEKNGFYYYYSKKCDSSCLTVQLSTVPSPSYPTSATGGLVMSMLNYPVITDIDVDKDPTILKKYSKIFVLHNEYVTKKEFDAITNHPNVVYLYPNALYAEVKIDYKKNTMTLVKGHGYPSSNISNGFNWKFDNSQYEYDFECKNWEFTKIKNGKMLNCYPYIKFLYDEKLLRESVK